MTAFLLRWRWVVLAVVGAALVGGAVASELGGRRPQPGTVETAGGAKTRVRGTLGPTPGPDAEGYIARKRRYLERVAAARPGARAAALVSLARFLGAGEVAALVGQARVDLVFVRFPGEEPSVLAVEGTVEVSMGAAAARLAARLEAEAGQLDQLARAGGPDSGGYRQRAAELRLRARAARAACACAYALLLGPRPLGELVELQGRAEVRLVDVTEPPLEDLRGWELRPVLPRG